MNSIKVCLVLCSLSLCVLGHIPYSELAEPNDPIYVALTPNPVQTREQSANRLSALRAVLADYGVDAYVIPTADAHNSAYIAPSDARREWISGLSGSSGTAVVSTAHALVWTDARYFTQFYVQVNTDLWTLMRQGTDQSINTWLSTNLTANSVVGIDPTTYTRTAWTQLENNLRSSNITLRAIEINLVDVARQRINDPAPARPNMPLITHPIEFSGRRASSKIAEIQAQMTARDAQVLVLTALDDIAYTLNLRGNDIPYNPVFFSYLMIRNNGSTSPSVTLFWGSGTLPSDIASFLQEEGVEIDVQPYSSAFDHLRSISNSLPTGSTIWVSDTGSHALFSAAEGNGNTKILSTISPVVLTKCVKNEVELAGFRRAHIKDGTAVVRFMRWIHKEVDSGRTVTEIDVVDKLDELRREEEYSMGPSFSTIAGAGENGAIIHYKPERDLPHRNITWNDMLLVDSGGQYRDGTTDITRTRHMGSPTPMQRLAFTRVLQGNIALATVVFPRGTVGHTLETLARKSLWDVGLNYGHGTGHGLGHFLNVHEGPSWILSGPSPTDPGIVEGMVFSNEPGYYEVNEYGIRHEDVVEVITMNRNADHMLAEGIVGNFAGVGALGFHTISLAPHQTSSLNVTLLTDFEIKYINDYHSRVLTTIGPILLQRNLTEDYEWLQNECAPIQRSGSQSVNTMPIVIIVGFLVKIMF